MFVILVYFKITRFSCDSIAGRTGALLIEGLHGEGHVFAAHQWWQITHPH